MRRKILISLVVVILIAAIILFAFITPLHLSPDIGSWHQTTPYPFAVAYDQVRIAGNYIYVLGAGLTSIGNETDMTYYAPINQSGIGNWKRTTDTPANAIIQEQCIVYDLKVYCIGAYGDSSYFASISSNGISLWSKTTAYPINVTDGTQCFNQGSLMCCVGGNVGNNLTNNTFCSHLGNSGISAWNKSSNYPTGISKERVAVYGDYVYSIGGVNRTIPYFVNSRTINLYAISNASYYAKINPGGIGNWIKTTDYPFTTRSNGLTAYKGYLYGVGGLHCIYTGTGQTCSTLSEVFYAPISSTGIGNWSTSVHPYPFEVFHQGCAQTGNIFYCIGGIQTNINIPYSDAYYANLSGGA
jgi:hypothetical protein